MDEVRGGKIGGGFGLSWIISRRIGTLQDCLLAFLTEVICYRSPRSVLASLPNS